MALAQQTISTEGIYEIVSFKFKEGVAYEEQKSLMQSLNPIISKFEGFRLREFYYSKDNGRWIDMLIWTKIDLAKKASELIMKDTVAGKAFAKMDETSMIFSHYEKISENKK